MTLEEKLNDMFAIEGAKIVKTQHCPVGRWVFTLLMTLLFSSVYGVCIWSAQWFTLSAYIFLLVLLTALLAFVLVRLWFCFFVDAKSKKFAEETTFLRRGDRRYYLTKGRFLQKFEYEGGFIALQGRGYDKFEDKTDYSPLAGRFDRALQRRSSLYVTMSPSFWYDMIVSGEYVVGEKGVTAKTENGSVTLSCGADGKIRKIEYEGGGYYLYDSTSPIKIFDGKLPGKYRITYSFAVGEQSTLTADARFKEAIDDFLLPVPPEDCVTFVGKAAR